MYFQVAPHFGLRQYRAFIVKIFEQFQQLVFSGFTVKDRIQKE